VSAVYRDDTVVCRFGEVFRRTGRKPRHMVDFQERDESRGLGSDDDDEADEERAEAHAPEDADTPEAPTRTDDREDREDDRAGDHGHEDHDHHDVDHEDDDHGHDHHGEDHDHDHDHGHHRHDVDQVGVAVVTISSSRSLETDPAGDAIESAIETTGEVVTRELIRDDFDTIQGIVNRLADRDDVDVVVTAGGTGVTPDDVTIEAVRPLFSKELPGFGELFRILSHEDIGTKVVATRATAGIVDGVPVFCMPGSESAVRLGTEEIIVPEAGHLAGLAARGAPDQDD
jgi:molybdenum cofactor biosynthesis protein B